MDFFDILTMCGGLAFFLFGMHVLSSNLETLVGGKLESVLKKMTSTPIKGLALGVGVTAAIQSSSAVTVMLVGLVNSGIMSLSQSVGIIMGSNIGTTCTAWILSATGIEGDSIFINMLKPSNFSPIVALIGIGLIMFSKVDKRKTIGTIMLGFSILMTGMSLMSDAVSGLSDQPFFSEIMTMFNNPIIGVIIGATITALIQSSSASVGILASLSLTGGVTFGMAIPIIMGQNIGTCITALISSFGTNKNAKRVTAVHIYFNVIGTIICLTLFYSLNAIFNFTFTDSTIDPVYIAIVHTCFNLLTTAMLFPFAKQIEKLARITIKDKDDHKKEAVMLDDRLLVTPSFAIAESRNFAIEMAKLSQETVVKAMMLIDNYDAKKAEEIELNENKIDIYEDKLGSYLVKISSKSLSKSDSNDVSQLLHTIGDLERLGDHALNILDVAKEIDDKKLIFSKKAKLELDVMTKAVEEILEITIKSFENRDDSLAYTVEPLEEVIDTLKHELKNRHIKRLTDGKCTIELGFVLSEIINNYERVSDHCSNIAVCQIQIDNDSMDIHSYLDEVKNSEEPRFIKYFDKYKEKYTLPLSSSSSDSSYNPG